MLRWKIPDHPSHREKIFTGASVRNVGEIVADKTLSLAGRAHGVALRLLRRRPGSPAAKCVRTRFFTSAAASRLPTWSVGEGSS
jgi:hypothetical protein